MLIFLSMNLFNYLNTLTQDERDSFAARAKTNFLYLKQLKGGFRNPGPMLCRRMVAASYGVLTLAELRPDVWGDDDHASETTVFVSEEATVD